MPGREYHSLRPGQALLEVRERALRLGHPLYAAYEITHRCPLECRHCYLAGRRERDELATEEAKDLLRQAAGHGVLFLAITGGEPLLRDDLLEIVREGRRLGFVWRLLTTGTLMDAARARAVASQNPFAVDISLHGLEDAHDGLTGVRGSFRAAVDGIKRLVGLGVHVVAKTSLTPGGLRDLPALRALCARLGARLNVSSVMLPGTDGTPVEEDLRLSEEELARYVLESGGPSPSHRPLEDDEPVCGAGRASFSVSPRGDVRPCLGFRKACGNVREKPLREIWQSDAMAGTRRLTAADRPDCRGCPEAAYCFFCPALAEGETGSFLRAPPSACREARIRRALAE